MLEERAEVLQVLAELNRACAGQAVLEAYRWEDAVRDFDPARTYQANIPLPAEFDIFIGLLFSRIGTPLNAEAYARDLQPALARLHQGWQHAGTADLDAEAMARLADQLAPEEMPTGTRFEIENALAAARSQGKPVLWLAVNEATPEGLLSRDPDVAGPVRARWEAVGAFVGELERAQGVSINLRYGAEHPINRIGELAPWNLQPDAA